MSYAKVSIKKNIKSMIGRKLNSQDLNRPNFKKLDNFSQHLYVIFHETILPTLLRSYDRYSMMNGVEIRMSFMDHRIVTYVHSLPYSSKFGGGYTKKLIRDAMTPYIPKETTWRKSKIGFNTPIVDWMQKDLRGWFGDTVHERAFIESNLLDDSKHLKRNVMDIINKKENSFAAGGDFWTELTLFIWEKAVLKRNYKYG